MRASLHPDLRVAGKVLIDTKLDLRYSLTPDAAWLTSQLLQENHVETLITTVARRRRLSYGEARQAVYALLGQLGSFGQVRLQWERTLLPLADWRVRWRWYSRQPANVLGTARSLWRAFGVVFTPLLLVFGAARLGFGSAFPGGLLTVLALVVVSFIIHEVGHVVTIGLARVPAAILSRPGYMALLYKRPPAGVARRIAASGPLAAAAVVSVVGLGSGSVTVRCCALAIGLLHLGHCLPVSADGRALWRRS